MQFQAKVHLELPFKLDLSGMAERERFLRDDWFWVKEPETLKWIESFEKNTIFWDVGANIGVYSLYSAVLCSASMCYAFEPFLPNYERLKRNVEINGFWHSIKTEQIALSDEVGMANFESKSHEIGSSGGQIGNAKDYVPQNAYPVEITTRLHDGREKIEPIGRVATRLLVRMRLHVVDETRRIEAERDRGLGAFSAAACAAGAATSSAKLPRRQSAKNAGSGIMSRQATAQIHSVPW